MEEHSDIFKMMVANQERYGEMEDPDGYGTKQGDCGDTIEIYLKVEDERVKTVMFQVAGCLNTFACANMISYLAEGRNVSECWDITPENVITPLQSLPDDHHHCAELAVGTFYLALSDHSKKSAG